MIKKAQNLILCVFAFSIAAFGSTLAEYHKKITEVSESVAYLNYPEEYLSKSENINQQREILNEIRTKLPPTDSIELNGAKFEVNQDWLYDGLKKVEAEPYNSDKRSELIEELSARLATLDSKLAELEQQEKALRSKDEDKQKLDEILKRAEYQPPVEKEETWFQRKWREFLEWWNSLWGNEPETVRKREGSPILATGLLYAVLAVAAGLVLFLLYRFAPTFWQQYKNRGKKDDGSRIILGDTLSADDSSRSIFAEAEELARAGNLRGAIRKGYIAVLCELSDKKIIGLARHKTNRDYLRDLRKKTELHRNMNSLTVKFERNWYGDNPTDQREWEEFKEVYRQTVVSK